MQKELDIELMPDIAKTIYDEFAKKHIKLSAEEYEDLRWEYIQSEYKSRTPWQKYFLHQKFHNARQSLRDRRRKSKGFPKLNDGDFWKLLSNNHSLYWEHQIICEDVPTADKRIEKKLRWIHDMQIDEIRSTYSLGDIVLIFNSLTDKQAKWAIEKLNVKYSHWHNRISREK